MAGYIYIAVMLLLGLVLGDRVGIVLGIIFTAVTIGFFIYFTISDKIKSRRQLRDAEVKKQIEKSTRQFASAERKYKAQIADLEKRNMELSRVLTRRYQNNPYFTDDLRQDYLRSFETTRLDRALSDDATVPQKIELSAVMPSFMTPGVKYTTTLEKCGCTDKATRHNPCKHMISLALFVGATYDMNKDVEDLMRQYVERRADQTSNTKQAKSKKARVADK
ncbi:MAG: hypothetical protein IJ404_05610 [Clostridia bacterium]|nr:hypothetical protein [Clostridia bacterium]